MYDQAIENSRNPGRSAVHVLVYIAVPALVGLVLPFGHVAVLLAVLAVSLFAIFEILFPPGTVALVFLIACSVLPVELIPTIPAGFGADLLVTDLLLFYLLVSAFSRAGAGRSTRFPVRTPLVILCLVAVANAVVAVGIWSVPLMNTGSELRGYLYLLMALPIAGRITRRGDIRVFESIIKWTALFTAAVVVAQWASGDRLSLLVANTRQLRTLGQVSPQILRIKPPGMILMHMAFIMVLGRYMVSGKNRLANLLVLTGLGFGLVASFHRYVIVTIAASAVVFLFWMPESAMRKRIATAVVLVCSILSLSWLLASRVPAFEEWVEAVNARIVSLSMPEELGESDAIVNRFQEYRDAAEAISSHPFFGIGLGNSYRPESAGWNTPREFDRTRFLHNAYVMVQLKMGMAGLVFFLWVCGGFLWWWIKTAARPALCADPVLHRALGVAFIMFLVINTVSATMTTVSGAAVAGAVMALCHAAGRREISAGGD